MPGTLWFTRSDSLGSDPVIGRSLFQAFWNSLHDELTEPGTFAFMNRGIFLTLDDSPVLEALLRLEAAGSRIMSCGTCLDFYDAKQRLAVGRVGTMAEVQRSMALSDKVITL